MGPVGLEAAWSISSPCRQCPANAQSPAASDRCWCNAGHSPSNMSTDAVGGVCAKCRAGTYKSGVGNEACVACARGTYSSASGGGCAACPFSAVISPTGAFQDCTCRPNCTHRVTFTLELAVALSNGANATSGFSCAFCLAMANVAQVAVSDVRVSGTSSMRRSVYSLRAQRLIRRLRNPDRGGNTEAQAPPASQVLLRLTSERRPRRRLRSSDRDDRESHAEARRRAGAESVWIETVMLTRDAATAETAVASLTLERINRELMRMGLPQVRERGREGERERGREGERERRKVWVGEKRGGAHVWMRSCLLCFSLCFAIPRACSFFDMHNIHRVSWLPCDLVYA